MESNSISVERTFSAELIHALLTHPDILPSISDQDSPELKEEYINPEKSLYMLVICEGKIAGLFMVDSHNSTLFEVHTNILPNFRNRSLDACRSLWRWLCANTNMQTLITQVPKPNQPARRLALAFGMQDFGLIPKAWKSNDELHDIYLMGITKCQQ